MAGRPTIYNEQILKDTRDYIESCEDGEHNVKLPTIEGLAYHLKINKDTIYTWRKEKEEFSDLISELLAKQAQELVNKGLSGKYNSTIAKVLLTKHGYNDKIETDITSDGKKLDAGITNIINKIYGSNGKLSNDGEESE